MINEVIGKCTQCKDILILAGDKECRKWARYIQCGAQYPLEQGRMIVGEQPDKVDGNSLPESPIGIVLLAKN